jgi:hypothetical protein
MRAGVDASGVPSVSRCREPEPESLGSNRGLLAEQRAYRPWQVATLIGLAERQRQVVKDPRIVWKKA